MEKVVLNTKDKGSINVFKFAVLQKMAIEYYMAIEDTLTKDFEMFLSTKYKQRFSANSKEKRRLEKAMSEEMKTFKARARAYRQKNESMYDTLDSFRHQEQESIEKCVEEIYEFIDQLIVESNG